VPAGARGTLLVTASARLQSGLDFEQSLPTAGARLVVLDARYVWSGSSGAAIIPFARVQAGTLEQGATSTSARGLSVGLSLGAVR
jgi:hypothetical protein